MKVSTPRTVAVYMAIDDTGILYGGSNELNGPGTLWRIDPVGGGADLLVSGFSTAPALAFDGETRRLFASEQWEPYRIMAISIPPDTYVPSPKASIRTSEVEIRWPSQYDRAYNVEFRAKLGGSESWLPLATNIVGNGGVTVVTDKVPIGTPERIYRVTFATDQPPGPPR